MDNYELSKAIEEQDLDKVKRLLASGKYSINGDSTLAGTPIITCVSPVENLLDDILDTKDDSSSCEILRVLVNHGADVNVMVDMGSDWMTAAMKAAESGYLRCLQVLVESGADLSIMSPRGRTVLMCAVIGNCEKCVKYIIPHMSWSMLNHRDDTGNTALMEAADCGQLCLHPLISAGSELNVENKDGFTALMLAVRARSLENVVLLLQKGALVNTVTHFGETPPTLVQEFASGKMVPSVKTARPAPIILKLLHHGLDPTLSRRARNCLHEEVVVGRTAMVRGLVRHGFPPLDIIHWSPSLALDFLRSPLAVALMAFRPGIARYLIANRCFTRYDCVRLCWEGKIRRYLQDWDENLRARECLEILDFLSARPQTLRNLSLITISSVLSRDLNRDIQPTLRDKSRWICKPTFREKVELLELPPSLKRALLHQTPSSSICCDSWGDIPLDEDGDFPECHCKVCDGSIDTDADLH